MNQLHERTERGTGNHEIDCALNILSSIVFSSLIHYESFTVENKPPGDRHRLFY